MQQLLPVSWTDTSCLGIRLAQQRGTEYDHTAPGPRSLSQGVLSMGEDFEISENRKPIWAVTSEFSLPRLSSLL